MDLFEACLSLFTAGFVAATFFPAQSEILLATLQASGKYSTFWLVTSATAGNVLGAVMNYFIGVYFVHFKDKKWFPFKSEKLEKVSDIYREKGEWTLLFSWLPVIGDPLTLVAGIFKTPVIIFLILVTIGKALRYMAIVAVF